MNNIVNKAISEALKSSVVYKHGCVIFKNNHKIVSTGHNNHNCKIGKYIINCVHAEAQAMYSLCCAKRGLGKDRCGLQAFSS